MPGGEGRSIMQSILKSMNLSEWARGLKWAVYVVSDANRIWIECHSAHIKQANVNALLQAWLSLTVYYSRNSCLCIEARRRAIETLAVSTWLVSSEQSLKTAVLLSIYSRLVSVIRFVTVRFDYRDYCGKTTQRVPITSVQVKLVWVAEHNSELQRSFGFANLFHLILN